MCPSLLSRRENELVVLIRVAGLVVWSLPAARCIGRVDAWRLEVELEAGSWGSASGAHRVCFYTPATAPFAVNVVWKVIVAGDH
jgi:hypothetical protein